MLCKKKREYMKDLIEKAENNKMQTIPRISITMKGTSERGTCKPYV